MPPISDTPPIAITFIDAGVTDVDRLTAGLPADTAYFILDYRRDGMRQMAEILAPYHDPAAIHLISHAAPGNLRLGTALLNATSFPGHALGEFQNFGAFAAIKTDGSVVAWGDGGAGGDIGNVAGALNGNIDVKQIYSTGSAFAALRSDGSVVAWGGNGGDSTTVAGALNGDIDVVQIFSTRYTFAALRADGSVITWGDADSGGSSVTVAGALNGAIDVVRIFSTEGAFAALRADGSVVVWGNDDAGGNSSQVVAALNGEIDTKQITSTAYAFAALRSDGSVVTWGDEGYGGDSSAVTGALHDVEQIYANSAAFAALRSDGSVVAWGDGAYGGNSNAVAGALHDVVRIYANGNAFAALRADGSVITWGDSAYGGDSSAVANALNGSIGVTQIYSTYYAFAALRADGSVITWGKNTFNAFTSTYLTGGDSSAVAEALDGTVPVTQVYATNYAFAALRSDGSVVTWGDGNAGGDSSAVAGALQGDIDVTQIYSTAYAFAALRADGSAVAWGSRDYGGNSNEAADKLASKVESFANIYTDDVYAANSLPSGGVILKGVTRQGQVLNADTSTLNDADGLGDIHYQWWRDGKLVDGATDSRYRLTQTDVNTQISVTVSYVDQLGSLETVRSEVTAKIINVNDVPAGTVTIQGVVKQGSVLKAANTLSDADGLGEIHYVWLAGGVQVGAGASYRLSEAELGKSITVQAKYSDGYGKAEAVSSTATAPVQGLHDGTPNNEKLIGGNNSDRIDGWAGSDEIIGGFGNDTLLGNLGNDTLNGGNDNDSLSGDAGNDTLLGGSGNDRMDGGTENDYLQGDNGQDTLNGGNGADTMIGGDGNDVYSVDNQRDAVDEADGIMAGNRDAISSQITFNLSISAKNVENLTLVGVSPVDGTGSDWSNTLVGNAGDNRLDGLSGNDSLQGGKGDDTLDGGIGIDTLAGGDGSDRYRVSSTEDIIVETAQDGDADVIESKADYALGNDLEQLQLTGTARQGVGNALHNRLDGNEMGNDLAGMPGNDTLNGNGGEDTLDGGAGNDVINGGDGNDQVGYAGASGTYRVVIDQESQTLTVTDANGTRGDAVNEGKDTLINVELLVFADQEITLQSLMAPRAAGYDHSGAEAVIDHVHGLAHSPAFSMFDFC